MNVFTKETVLEPIDNRRLNSLSGPFNENIKLLENRLGIEINYRGNRFTLIGIKQQVLSAIQILHDLYQLTLVQGHIQDIEPSQIHLAIKDKIHRLEKNIDKTTGNLEKPVTIQIKSGSIKPHTPHQEHYISNIINHHITFGIGPAGTGKTYLAVATAVNALEKQQVHHILLTRPAVEAGEKLGFLPGDLNQKVDPYLRPLYDALFEILGFDKVEKLIEKNVIEVAPLAYMRGRTLNDAFIILDEGQNTTSEQMKMFLTRIGFNSKVVITGDITQIDLPKNQRSGLKQAIEILAEVEGISFNFFHSDDVVRHPIVGKIIDAYEEWQLGQKECGQQDNAQTTALIDKKKDR